MNSKTAIIIGLGVVAICATVIACVKLSTDRKVKESIWGSTPYNANSMNSLNGAFQTAAAEGGAGHSLF